MSRYGKILICVCLSDLFLTVLGLQMGLIGEANGILQRVLHLWGIEALVAVKALLTMPCIFLLEHALRNPNPKNSLPIETYYKLAVCGYVISFVLLTILVNFF